MKIRIYLKNGTVLPDFECADLRLKYDTMIGNRIEYKYVKYTRPRPLFIDASDVSAIIKMED